MNWQRLGVIAALTAAGYALVALWMSVTSYTYVKLHLFLLIPTLLLMFVPPLPLSNFTDPAFKPFRYAVCIVLVAVAFVFSAPWEHILARAGILNFNQSSMLGMVGGIPYEECFWWVDHSLLVAFWVMSIMPNRPVAKIGNPHFLFRICGTLLSLGIVYFAYSIYDTHANFYVSVTLMFMFPVIAFQFLVVGHILCDYPFEWFLGVLVPSVITTLIDRYAIEVGIWYIPKERTTGITFFGFMLEHIFAYGLTSALAAQMVIPSIRSVQLYKIRRYDSKSFSEAYLKMYTFG